MKRRSNWSTKTVTNKDGEKVIVDRRRKNHKAAIRLTDGKKHPVTISFAEPRRVVRFEGDAELA